jgi:hypothetical protein
MDTVFSHVSRDIMVQRGVQRGTWTRFARQGKRCFSLHIPILAMIIESYSMAQWLRAMPLLPM